MSDQPHIPTWGDFQSVIQLSIALNVAYVALYNFVEDNFDKKIKNINDIQTKLKTRSEFTPDIRDRKNIARDVASDLYRDKDHLIKYSRVIVKPLSLSLSFFGVFLLIFSSLYYKQKITDGWIVLNCVLLGPFMFAVIVYGYFTIKNHMITLKLEKLSLLK